MLVSMLAGFVGIFFCIGVNNMNWCFQKPREYGISVILEELNPMCLNKSKVIQSVELMEVN